MEAIVKEDIVIRNFTDEFYDELERRLTFKNPEYYKRLSSGRWTGGTPETISLIQRNGRDLIVPFGVLPYIFENRKKFSGIYNAFGGLLTGATRLEYGSGISPYPYQEKAVTEALRARQGIIVAPCGGGKTQIGLELAARIGGRTLWLTHTTDLLKQSMERARSNYMLSEQDYGTITAGKVDVGRVITFATVQTMSRIDLSKLKDSFDCVIVDEAHHVVGSPTMVMMFYKVISSLCARYKYGLTATPKRADGLTPCMFAMIGEKVCEITMDDVKDTTCKVSVVVKKTSYSPDLGTVLMPDGTLNYQRLIGNIVYDGARNDKIVDDVANADGTCLILTERVAHVELLAKKLERVGVKVATLSATVGKKAKMERDNVLLALNNKCIKAVVATYQLAKEGLDVPTLDNLFFATPQKNETIVTQSAGRVGRKADNKVCGTLYDYEDSFSMLAGWQRKRESIYRKLGYDVVKE